MAIEDMVKRHSNFDETKDYIPTPPYATRALYHYASPDLRAAAGHMSVWDPAAGEGHMGRVFWEQGHSEVFLTDLYDHGPGYPRLDFSDREASERFVKHQKGVGAIVTNPPYKNLEVFVSNGLALTDRFLCLLVRVQALETQGRYKRIYAKAPPTSVHIFADRIPFKIGEVVRKCPKMFLHTWLVWDKTRMGINPDREPLGWIPPEAQKELEKDKDYV